MGDEIVIRCAGLQMKPRLSTAFFTGLTVLWIGVPAASDAGSCRHLSERDCFKLPATLDFSSVPDISNEIVSDEPKVQAPQKPAIDPEPAAEPYTGPMFGVNKNVGGPTVGYYWSIH
jgi:hypothetical protein